MRNFLSLVDRRFLFLGTVALAIFIPLYPKLPAVSVPGTYVAIRIEDFLIAAVLLLWLILKATKLKRILKEPIFQSIVLFWAIGALSVFSAYLVTHTVSLRLSFLEWLRRIEYMSLFFIAATSVRSARQIRALLNILGLVMVIVSLYGLGQRWLHFPVVSTLNRELSKGEITHIVPGSGARINSTFAGHYDLAVFLAAALTVLIPLFFSVRKIYQRILLVGSGLVATVALGLTAARTSFAAAVVGSALALLLIGKRKLIIGLILVAALTVLIVPGLRDRLLATIQVNILHQTGPTYIVPSLPQNLTIPSSPIPQSSRAAFLAKSLGQEILPASENAKLPVDVAPGEPINSTDLDIYRSAGIRFNVEWPRAVAAFAKNPLLGTGYSSITLATDNDILRSLGETGLMGTLALALVFVIFFKRTALYIKRSRGFQRYFSVGVLSALVGILITGVFIDILESSKIAEILWLVLGTQWALMNQYDMA